ncbi:hypothetical protein A0H81_08394 [Grifola frondosa]|uniref:Uncharacterized protein n=1 Tax=Grifola frondosa TaxID=5627 RepID=A0A1C7M598_GRIFR|nr:hypothetical protein A0H81_08394 [Grifola frondosa]
MPSRCPACHCLHSINICNVSAVLPTSPIPSSHPQLVVQESHYHRLLRHQRPMVPCSLIIPHLSPQTQVNPCSNPAILETAHTP